MSKEPMQPFGKREGVHAVTQVEAGSEAQKVIDLALEKAVAMYLHACEMYQKLREAPTDQYKQWDESARERKSGSQELLGVLLDAYGYDVRMEAPNLPGEEPSTFIQWTKVEREVIKYGYVHGLIERDHMLAWFDHNQENGWLRHDKQPIPA